MQAADICYEQKGYLLCKYGIMFIVGDTLSLNRDPCVKFRALNFNVVHACSIVVHKWVWIFHPFFFAFFSDLCLYF